jgi:hypothetical protein
MHPLHRQLAAGMRAAAPSGRILIIEDSLTGTGELLHESAPDVLNTPGDTWRSEYLVRSASGAQAINTNMRYHRIDSGVGDVEVEATFTTVSVLGLQSRQVYAPNARLTKQGHDAVTFSINDVSLKISEFVSAVETILYEDTGITFATISFPVTLRLKTVGTDIECYMDDTLVFSGSLSAASNGERDVGFHQRGSHVLNFKVWSYQ